ncbi:pentatricopeptide repeat-containing protein At3g49740 [Lactuca sativa]|uniref:Pentacotripeptide-repeat region of PRORP domain-containing protein n=1 Tax=Lactuca sativa TaxID=4236 RepID=A0A9R1VRP7_LACSA|nr:pentatricopeptide repeat-containing protein At3g49740 [Lactuca sativa]KAJ0210778.1 hypothetical protein LSAT_V11C400218710 [Lactuca sativa]
MNSELIKVNCLLAKLTKSQQYTKTLQLFHKIQSSHYLKPDQYTLSTTLTACANLRDDTAGNQVHAQVIKTGYKIYSHVANTLLFLYSKSEDLASVKRVFAEIKIPDVYSWTTLLSACTNLGEVDYACHLLDQIPHRDEAVWNAVITGCADNGYPSIALDMFNRMHLLGIRHDNYSYASVLSMCSSELIDYGVQVHSLVIKTGFLVKPSVTNALITMYFNFGNANDAHQVFDETEHDHITYNAMISGLVSMGKDENALVMFKNMQEIGLNPTERTYVSLMSSSPCKNSCTQLHAHSIKTGFHDSNSVSNAAITMYSNNSDFHSAELVFMELEQKDRVSWNTMITIHAQSNSNSGDAIPTYLQMQHHGIKPDEFTIGSLLSTMESIQSIMTILAIVIKNNLISKTEVSNALISNLSKRNGIKEAYIIFNETNSKNLISWNSMISGFHSNGYSFHALNLFSNIIVSRLTPDVYTLTMVLNICATISSLTYGKEIHGYIIKSHYFHDTSLGNSLIALYSKCGDLNWSSRVFDLIIHKDVISWNSMISAYGQHGKGEKAISCFESMQDSDSVKIKVKVKPDHTTFIVVLTACSHAGLVEDGVKIFKSMVNEYGLEPGVDHFSCVVDLLGRAGYLDEVEKMVKSDWCNVDCSVWWSLFSSCAAHGDLRLGRIVGGILLEMEEDKSSVYVVLANMLADGGFWEEAEGVRKMMRGHGVVKQPGYSWIRS